MFKLAVFGLGWWGSKLLRNVQKHPLVEQVVGIDPSRERREAVSSELDAEVVEDGRTIFENPEIDAVVIATPPATHFPLAEAAFESGKDVLVTKPPTLSIGELEALVESADRHRRIFMMDSTFVYSQPVRKIKEVLEQGLFQDIRLVQSLRYGNDLRMHHVSRLNKTMIENGINVIEDLFFHDMAILQYLFPSTNLIPKTVHRAHTLSKDICDIAFIRMEAESFPIHVGLSWTLPERRREFLIADNEKQLIFDDLEPDNKLKLFWIEEKREELIEHGNSEPLFRVVDHFIHCIKQREDPLTNGEYMLKVMKGYKSVIELDREN
jgi:predicted dehydrogenase